MMWNVHRRESKR